MPCMTLVYVLLRELIYLFTTSAFHSIGAIFSRQSWLSLQLLNIFIEDKDLLCHTNRISFLAYWSRVTTVSLYPWNPLSPSFSWSTIHASLAWQSWQPL